MTEEEVYRYYDEQNYVASDVYNSDPVLKKVVDAFVDGSIPNIYSEGQEIYDSLLKYNDEFFVLRDFKAYCIAQHAIDTAYKDRQRWKKISLINTANAGRFSADYTVKKYADDIWQIEPVFAHVTERGAQHGTYLL